MELMLISDKRPVMDWDKLRTFSEPDQNKSVMNQLLDEY